MLKTQGALIYERAVVGRQLCLNSFLKNVLTRKRLKADNFRPRSTKDFIF